MENREQVGGNEKIKRNLQSASAQSFPEAAPGSGSGSNPKANPSKEDQTSFDSENREAEINPGELDRQEIDLDRSGVATSQTHQSGEYKAQQENAGTKDGNLSQGSNNRGVSGGAGGAQFGQGANTPGREDIDKQSQRNGVGGGNDSVVEKKIKAGNQNGGTLTGQDFGSSGTSGANSGGMQGYGSGIGQAGSQNGSTGYNAGSQGTPQKLRGSNSDNAGSTQGTYDNSLRGSNGGMDGEKSGKGSGVNRGKDAEGKSLH